MGIHGFQPWQRKKFPTHYGNNYKDFIKRFGRHNQTEPIRARRLFIDYNALVHNAVGKIYSSHYNKGNLEVLEIYKENPNLAWTTENGVFAEVFNLIVELIDTIEPLDLLYIGADGPVPAAKLYQQRQRSHKSLLLPAPIFDRDQIKPGTEFMKALSADLKKRLRKAHSMHPELWPRKIEFSDETIAGEGEHKIMERMIKDKTTKRGVFDVVYSPDSDMSLLVQLHAGLEQNVVVIRHTHEWIEYITRGAEEEPEQWEMYNATGIRADLRQTFGDIKEFVLCSCFAGNDFLPGLPLSMGFGTEVFDAVIDAYTKAFSGNLGRINLLDTSISGIHWANLSIYLDHLFLSEAGVLVKIFEKQTTQEDLYLLKDQDTQEVIGDRRWSVLLESRASITTTLPPSMREAGAQKVFQTFDYFIFCRLYQNYVCGTWSNVDEYRGILNFNQTPNMCHSYLAGFVWILSYYTERTKNLNVNWAYGYNYAPTAYDLKKELEKYKRTPFWVDDPMLKTGEIVTPLEHLVTILPSSKLHLMPKIAQSYFSGRMPDHYVDSFQVDMTSIPYNADKARELETAKVLINFPSRSRIETIYKQIQTDDIVQAINKVNPVMKVGATKKRK